MKNPKDGLICNGNPVNTKHLYNVGSTSKTLGPRCTNDLSLMRSSAIYYFSKSCNSYACFVKATIKAPEIVGTAFVRAIMGPGFHMIELHRSIIAPLFLQ